ncbi:unnamed protein product [Clavelina lepadiformis]|uniref:TIR domain-containing protein n=1 Tax=Clavelina lepadiformis TaxID=159417 RepID=A0ABP0FTQ2_CLALP
MSKPEEQRLTEDKPQLVQPDDNEESSSGESDEQPGTSRAVAMQAGMPHGPADAGNQVLQTMEDAEASQSVVNRIDPGLIEPASKIAESGVEPNNPQATNSLCGPGANQHQDDNKGIQHIMISYNWKDSKDLAHKISDELSSAGYKVWIDKNEMRGNIYDKMYEAVDNAYLVLMFLSENYKLSENCKREGNLVADKRKRIIPIITQNNYKMEGWTALLVSGKLYYDFSKESFQDNFNELIKEIDPPDVTHPKQPTEANPQVESQTATSVLTNETNALDTEVPVSDIPEKRRIWIDALKLQLVRFEKLQWKDWEEDDKRRYISLLWELNESSDMELFNMASLHFPKVLNLWGLKLSSSEAAIFCDVLRKQQKELKLLDLRNCFSPGDVERLISAISEMPGKV